MRKEITNGLEFFDDVLVWSGAISDR